MTFDAAPMSRRRFARLAAAATVGALVAGGCRDVGKRGVSLRFWNGFTGPDGPPMLRLVQRFNASQDAVQVTMQRMDWGTYYNKLFVAGMGGRAPEVFVVHTDALERFFQADFLAPIDSVFASAANHDGVDANDIDANVLGPTRREGRTYALPLDVHPAGVFYNKRLFAGAGIARPPETRAEFVNALHKLKRADGASSQWGFVYEWLRVNLFTLLRQFDGAILADDLTTVTLDSPKAIEAMTFARSLIADGLVSPIENTNAFIGFRQGRVGMVWAGIFMLQEAKRQADLEWGVSTIPIVGDRAATFAGSHNLCLRADLNERERAGAETFLRFLSDHTLDWAEAGQVPVRRSLRATDRFKAMTAQATFARQIPHVQYLPSTPFTFEYQTEFDVACEALLRGTKTPARALGDAAANIRVAAARFAPRGARGPA